MRVGLKLKSIQLPSQPTRTANTLARFVVLVDLHHWVVSSTVFHQTVRVRNDSVITKCRHGYAVNHAGTQPSSQLPGSSSFECVIETLMLPHSSGWICGDCLGKGRAERACRVSSVGQSMWDACSIFISSGQYSLS